MNVFIDALKLTGYAMLVVFLVPIIITIAAYVGYFFGLIVSVFAGGILTGVLPITTGAIPHITAWLFVFGLIVTYRRGSEKNE
ncbi:hypothetical protein [Ornithinibacillus bavariensis]|uniref:hypothetical protein n=1 Tax=Ornithinibacillus bavariensis TaxID=545502 RepID=UPI000ECD98ED|nr:hypothetical protein [Ornithinibacillus sp.]